MTLLALGGTGVPPVYYSLLLFFFLYNPFDTEVVARDLIRLG
jgi:hypothetical protein